MFYSQTVCVVLQWWGMVAIGSNLLSFSSHI